MFLLFANQSKLSNRCSIMFIEFHIEIQLLKISYLGIIGSFFLAKTTQMRCAKWVLNNDRMSKISILPCCREKTSELLLDRKKTTARKKCPTPYLITLPEAPTLKFSFFLTPFLLYSGPFSKFKTLSAQTGLGSNMFSRVT